MIQHALIRSSAPASLAVSLDELKDHVHELSSDFDTLLTTTLEAAIKYVEGVLGRSLVTQTWQLSLDRFPGRKIRLPMGPVASVTSIKYTPTNDTEQTYASSNYTVWTADDSLSLKVGSSWPGVIVEPGGITITYVAGQAVEDVPEELKLLVKLLAAHWYRHPEAATEQRVEEVGIGFNALLHANREMWMSP